MAEAVPTPETQTEKPVNTKRRDYKKWLVILVVFALGVAGGYFWRTYIDRQDQKTQTAHTALLQSQIDQLKKAAAAKKTAAKPAASQPSAPAAKRPDAATIENITASITSGNTAALEGYMAPSVSWVIAASEGQGSGTPTEAVSQITSFIRDASTPWNFDIPAATLSSWRSHFYGKYFPDTVLAGESANSQVIAFNFDSNGKISAVFLAGNADLLTQ